MSPVRVVMPANTSCFPLKMVAIGAGGELDLALWIFAPQRMHGMNYPDAVVDTSRLVWDFAAGQSNYLALFRQAIAAQQGRGWVTEFSDALTILSRYERAAPVEARQDLEPVLRSLPSGLLTFMHTKMDPALMTADLELEAAPSQAAVTNALYASQLVNTPPPPVCPDGGAFGPRDAGVASGLGGPLRLPGAQLDESGCAVAPGAAARGGLYGLVFVALAGAVAAVGRRRRSRG
jgi:hypothetical protein